MPSILNWNGQLFGGGETSRDLVVANETVYPRGKVEVLTVVTDHPAIPMVRAEVDRGMTVIPMTISSGADYRHKITIPAIDFIMRGGYDRLRLLLLDSGPVVTIHDLPRFFR